MLWQQYVGPVVAEELAKRLPPTREIRVRLLPDGTSILVGTEHIYVIERHAMRPKPCAVDLGGDVPFVAWKEGV